MTATALLGNQARFLVNLKDVDAIDPTFAAKLRAAGVNNSLQQRNMALQNIMVNGVVIDDGDPLPPPLKPGAGSAFADDLGPLPPSLPPPPPPPPPSGGTKGGKGLFGWALAAAARPPRPHPPGQALLFPC